MKDKIILASRSPRRSQLLEWAEIPFEILVMDTDESYPSGLSFEETAMHIARNKAKAVRNKVSENITVLAADTIVVWKDHIIGKPADREDAIRILHHLSGSRHDVVTGVVILKEGKIGRAHV